MMNYKAAASEKGGNSIHALSLGVAALSLCGVKVRPTGRDFDITESHACRKCCRAITSREAQP